MKIVGNLSNSDPNTKLGYPVMEMFHSLQGEGFHSGKPAFFIRLGGCDVGCHWCDVKESWDATAHPHTELKTLESLVSKNEAELVIVTGGEPLMYDLRELTDTIRKSGKRLHLETSGVYPLSGRWDWVTFSPKKFKKPDPVYYSMADELKVVVFHPSDLDWAEEHARQMNEKARLFLQPEWSKRETIIPSIMAHLRKNPKWRVSLQIHKYLNLQ